MKKSTIQVNYPTEKLDAVRHYTAEKGGDLNAELEDALQKLYERMVPKDVRAYLEIKEQGKPVSRPRAARPAAAAMSGADSLTEQAGV